MPLVLLMIVPRGPPVHYYALYAIQKAHFIITLISLGSQNEHYNEVAVSLHLALWAARTTARVMAILLTPLHAKYVLATSEYSCWFITANSLFMEKPLSTVACPCDNSRATSTTTHAVGPPSYSLKEGLQQIIFNTKVFQLVLAAGLLHADITFSFSDKASFNRNWQQTFHHGFSLFRSTVRALAIQTRQWSSYWVLIGDFWTSF